jgi:ABC-type multidrug transport system permease subunit
LVYVAVVVPAGFGDALRGDGESAVRMVFGRNDPQEASRLVPVLQSAAQRVSVVASADEAAVRLLEDVDRREEAEAAARERALEVLGEDRIAVSREELELPSRHALVGFQQSVPGMGSMFVMLSVLAGAAMLVEERSRWTLQRTLIAPVSYSVFVSGKVLGRFLIGIVQYLVAIITGLLIGEFFGIDFGSSPLLMAAVMASFVLAMASVSVLLATIVRREQQASGLTTLLAVTLAPLGGAWWSLDIEIIPEIMRQIARISPFYWVMDGFRAAVHDLGWARALPSLGVLLGIALVAGALAIRRLARTWSG